MKNADHLKESKPQKAQGKIKNEKPSSVKSGSAAGPIKSNVGKDVERTSTSNGSVGLHSSPKQLTKSKSFDDRQDQVSKVKFCNVLLFYVALPVFKSRLPSYNLISIDFSLSFCGH